MNVLALHHVDRVERSARCWRKLKCAFSKATDALSEAHYINA